MAAPRNSTSWGEIVALMRQDARLLGQEPAHAPRFLMRVLAGHDSMFAQLRRAWGLNAHEMLAVTTLWEFGRMTMTELGQRIPLSRAAVTTLSDRLEELGYVHRAPDPSDRRRVLLEVSDRVEQQLAHAHARWNERVEAYVASLDPERWAIAADVLADLREIARSESDALREMDPSEVAALGMPVPSRRASAREDAKAASWW